MRNESRSSPRHRRRWKIALNKARANERASAWAAFTVDVSAGGFSAELMRVPAAGTEVTGWITIAGQEYPFSGRVVWARASEARMNVSGRIGVTFREIADGFGNMLT